MLQRDLSNEMDECSLQRRKNIIHIDAIRHCIVNVVMDTFHNHVIDRLGVRKLFVWKFVHDFILEKSSSNKY